MGVGSGNSGIGGNMYMKAGQTWASNKDGGHVAVMGGTGGQASAAKETNHVSKQYHLRDIDCHLADCSTYTHASTAGGTQTYRESDTANVTVARRLLNAAVHR